jgi:hypothetical protein
MPQQAADPFAPHRSSIKLRMKSESAAWFVLWNVRIVTFTFSP